MLTTSIKNGAISGIKSSWFLIKIIVPVYFIITILNNTPAMDWLTAAASPLVAVFNLPGEAAVPLMTAVFLDEYGVIAAIKAVNLTGFGVTVIAVMTLISHSLILEAAISKKLGLSATFFTAYRLLASVLCGLVLNLIGTVLNLW